MTIEALAENSYVQIAYDENHNVIGVEVTFLILKEEVKHLSKNYKYLALELLESET